MPHLPADDHGHLVSSIENGLSCRNQFHLMDYHHAHPLSGVLEECIPFSHAMAPELAWAAVNLISPQPSSPGARYTKNCFMSKWKYSSPAIVTFLGKVNVFISWLRADLLRVFKLA